MKKRKLDFTKDMPLGERRRIQNKRCLKCINCSSIEEYENIKNAFCKRYYYYWHYIRCGFCEFYRKKKVI